MKRLALALALGLLLTGCTLPERSFVDGVDTAWTVIGPEYTAYVDADPALSAQTKETRKRTAALLSRLIEAAKQATTPAPAPEAPQS